MRVLDVRISNEAIHLCAHIRASEFSFRESLKDLRALIVGEREIDGKISEGRTVFRLWTELDAGDGVVDFSEALTRAAASILLVGGGTGFMLSFKFKFCVAVKCDIHYLVIHYLSLINEFLFMV